VTDAWKLGRQRTGGRFLQPYTALQAETASESKPLKAPRPTPHQNQKENKVCILVQHTCCCTWLVE